MDAIDDDDTDQDTDGVETCTMEKTKDQSITQELQNNVRVGMQSIQCMHRTYTHAVYITHTLHSHPQLCMLTHVAVNRPPIITCN